MILNFNDFKLYEYNNNWDQTIFDNLKSFNKKIEYCNNNLQKISSGSSRNTYLIEGEKKLVLKLAKNNKGLAQNRTEINLRSAVESCASIFNYNTDYIWLEMEYANKLTLTKFKSITGFKFKDFCIVIKNFLIDNRIYKSFIKTDINPDIESLIFNHQLYFDICDLIMSYNMVGGDLLRLNSYGEIDNNIVIIDFGLDNNVYNNYYKK